MIGNVLPIDFHLWNVVCSLLHKSIAIHINDHNERRIVTCFVPMMNLKIIQVVSDSGAGKKRNQEGIVRSVAVFVRCAVVVGSVA